MRLGALEAGGTKMVCAVGDETGKIFEQISIPTRTPEETVPEMIACIKKGQLPERRAEWGMSVPGYPLSSLLYGLKGLCRADTPLPSTDEI